VRRLIVPFFRRAVIAIFAIGFLAMQPILVMAHAPTPFGNKLCPLDHLAGARRRIGVGLNVALHIPSAAKRSIDNAAKHLRSTPSVLFWRARRDSNPRPSDPKSDALIH
jgi:hypothetical protein